MEFRVWGPPPRLNHPPLEGPEMVGVEGLGLKIWGLGFGTLGLGFGVWGLGFRIWSLVLGA